MSPAAASNFDRVRSSLPADLDVVAAGGWNQLTSLAENPKAALIDLIADTRSSDDSKRDEKLNALVALLQAQGKGFEADLIDGEWTAVLGRNSKKILQILGGRWNRKFQLRLFVSAFEGGGLFRLGEVAEPLFSQIKSPWFLAHQYTRV